MPLEFKKCSSCQVVKPRAEFWKRNRAGGLLQSRCIDCLKLASKMYKIRPKVAVDEKFCPRCETVKPSAHFYTVPGRKDGRAGFCKPCDIAYKADWRRNNPVSDRESKAKYRNSDHGRVKSTETSRAYYLTRDGKEKQRAKKLEREFGITVEQYDRLLAEQKGVCGICGQSPNGQYLSVDHCHMSQTVRGLLCRKCNSAIGLLGDNPNLVKSAFQYLAKHR